MMPSKTARTVVSAAKLMKRKKSEPQKRPPAIWLKTFGNVTKTRLGPAS